MGSKVLYQQKEVNPKSETANRSIKSGAEGGGVLADNAFC